MIEPIVHGLEPVTLVGGGDATAIDLHEALMLGRTCVAADGGAVLALAEKVDLAAVIGDFDSVSPETLAQIPQDRRHLITEQTSTDFEKALTRISAPVVLGVGFLGGRVDHQLAAFHTLMACPERPCVLVGAQEVICLAPPKVTLPTQDGDVVSLFPLGPVQGKSSGLVWPIDGLTLEPGMRVGTSNRAQGPVTLEIDRPNLLLILPRRLMTGLSAALMQAQTGRWPAL